MLNLPIQNIYNHGKTIYLFNRYGDKLSIMKEETFKPYFYEEDPTGVFRAIDGKRVKKIFCRLPSEIKRRKTNNSYEADIFYSKRYMIDNVEEIVKSNPKYFFIDIEVKAPELPNPANPIYPITCISLYNSLYESIQTWYLNDYEGTIEEREDKLLTHFVNYIKEEQPDILSGWNFIEFDYAYLYARIQKLWNLEFSKLISPIDETRYSKFEFTYPAGISVLDYLELFKKIYKGEVSYALNDIAQKYLKTPPNKKVDFNSVSEDIKSKNIQDIQKMVDLEKQKQIIPYYDEIRRMGKCTWEDINWNSKVLDVMLLTESKQMGIVLPSKNYEEKESNEKEFEGAYRKCNIEDKEGNVIKKLTGVYKELWKLDLAGAYPNAIINFCLDISNLTDNKNEHKIDITDRVTNEVLYSIYIKQNPTALLPTLARKLLIKKDILKKKLKSLDPESSEAKDLQIKYDAIKGLVNSLFGICGLKIFRLYNKNIASAITSIIRDLLHYVENKLIEKGIEVIYIDTDSLFIKSKDNPTDLLNQLVKEWAKEKHNKENVGIEFDCEGIYERILIVALCVHAFTKILTNMGWKFISWIYKNSNKIKIASINLKNNKIDFVNIIKAIKTPLLNRKLYKINLKYGMQKNCRGIFTEDHPILTKRGYKKVLELNTKDKIHTGEFKISGKTEQALIGTLLGDTFLRQSILYIVHSNKQKKYANHKAKLFIRHKYKANYYINKNYNNKMCKIYSRSSLYFKYLEDLFYKIKNKKRIRIIPNKILSNFSIISLAYLFMDDGYMNINQKQSEIAVCSFTLKENIKLSNTIKRLGINNKVMKRGKYYRICFGAKETMILSKKIAPWVIMEMNYKLRPEHRKIKKIEIIYSQESFYSSYKINKYNSYKRKEVYDLMLDKNYNFITPGGVVHNCHYKGYLKKLNGKIKEEIKGIEVKRKDSSKFMKKFYGELVEKALNEESKEQLEKFIEKQKVKIKTVPIIELGFPCKVNNTKEYSSPPIFVRALEYTNELIDFKKTPGNTFYYIYVKPFGQAKRISKRRLKNKETGKKELRVSETMIDKNVLAFDEENYQHIKDIDWNKMINKTITKKSKHIFEALDYNEKEIKPKKINLKLKIKTTIVCDFEQCKQNKKGKCNSDNPIDCPKNNNTSVYENSELIKKQIEKIIPESIERPKELKNSSEEASIEKADKILNEKKIDTEKSERKELKPYYYE